MNLQETSLLRLIWQNLSWRDEVLAAFEGWVQDGASREDMQGKVAVLIEVQLPDQAASQAGTIDVQQVHWQHVIEFLCMCFYRRRLRSPLLDVPPDDVWMRLTDELSQGPLSPHPQPKRAIKETVPVPLVPLEQKLLALGGTRMVYRPEPDLRILLERGEPFDRSAELVVGEVRECHANVARLWNAHREALAIVTGYALSTDDLWRQHSWLLRKKPAPGQDRLLETTVRRVKYFGTILNETEARAFAEMNG